MRVETDLKLGFRNVLIKPKRSNLKSRSQVNLERNFSFLHSRREWSGVPVIAANMDTTGTFEVAAVLADYGMLTAIHKHYSPDQWSAFLAGRSPEFYSRIMVSSGAAEEDFVKLGLIVARHPDLQFICLDVANGYTEAFVEYVGKVRSAFPDKTIVAGNVVTGEMVEELLLSGADIVKVGIGPGSVCTTRKMTGVGYPQLSAVIECADAAHGLKGLVCADGGCTVPGDIAKAYGGGADFVMLGGMLAGHDECEGEILYEEVDGEKRPKSMVFYGMSSDTAMKKYAGGVAHYRASEGKTVEVAYRGPVDDTMQEIMGGVRSMMTYIGATRLKEVPKRTTFVMVGAQLNNVFGQ